MKFTIEVHALPPKIFTGDSYTLRMPHDSVLQGLTGHELVFAVPVGPEVVTCFGGEVERERQQVMYKFWSARTGEEMEMSGLFERKAQSPRYLASTNHQFGPRADYHIFYTIAKSES